MNKLELMKTANEIRKGAVTAVHSAKSGHPGGSLSAADIYTCLLYTSDAADELQGVDLGGRRIIKKKFFQAEDGIRDRLRSRGLGDVYKRQANVKLHRKSFKRFKMLKLLV